MDHYRSLPSYGDPYGEVQCCLRDILSCIKPSENDRLKRAYTINELETSVRSVASLKDVVVRPFGSFISNTYTKSGDLDISVVLSHYSPSTTSKQRKSKALREIMQVLRRNGVARILKFIPHARVPLLTFENYRHNVSCDVSIDNHFGWMKSRILLLISEIDEQFRDMVLLTKEWAKAHQINDPKSGTLNSYSLCLLVIFHFQTCEPAILPPLKEIYEGNFMENTGTCSGLERQMEDMCAANIARFKSSRQRNQSMLYHLLTTFFDKFSEIERLSSEYAICTYTGQWEMISSKPAWMEKSHSLIIEDPFERPDNAARAVSARELSTISEAFKRTSQKLSTSSIILDRNALLASLVRPTILSQLQVGPTESHYNTARGHQEAQHYAVSAYMTNSPLHELSRLKVGSTQSHKRTAQGNLGNQHFAISAYATDPLNESSQVKVGSRQSHNNTALANQRTQQHAISAFETNSPLRESPQVKVGSTQNHHYSVQGTWGRPDFAVETNSPLHESPQQHAISAVETNSPLHESPQVKFGSTQNHHYSIRETWGRPDFATSSFGMNSPLNQISRSKVGSTQSHNNSSQRNLGTPHFAISAYATNPLIETSKDEVGSRQSYNSTAGVNRGTQHFAISAFETNSPLNEGSQVKARSVQSHYKTAEQNGREHHFAISPTADDDRFQEENQSSPSIITARPRQGTSNNVHAQKVWKPRNSNS